MDPDSTLAALRDLISRLRSAATTDTKADLADELADTVDDLDGWLTRGGFLPRAWADRSSR
jgi:hypothetical protein